MVGAIPVSPKITNNHLPDFFGNKKSQQKQKLTTHRNTKKHHHDFLLHRFWASVFSFKKQEQEGETALIFEYCCEQTLHSIVKQTYPGGNNPIMGFGGFFRIPLGFQPGRSFVICCFGKKNSGGKKTKRAKGVFSNRGNQIDLDL